MSAWTELRTAAGDVARITLVTPVREGRPHPRDWPRGLREVGAAVAAIFVLLALATLFAVPLRQLDQLSLSQSTGNTLPAVAVPLLLTATLVSVALSTTAALHTSWWLRLLLLVPAGGVVFFFSVQAWTEPVWVLASVAGLLGLLGFVAVRAFRPPAWWEFAVVLGLLLLATVAPWLGTGASSGALWGTDLRPTILDGALMSLQALIVPALLVAGSAPAQIVVTGAQAAASRPVGRGLFWTGFAASVAWLAATLWLAVGSDDLAPAAVLAAAVAFALVAALVAVLVGRGGTGAPPEPRLYPEAWTGWLYPLAVAMTLLVVLSFPLILGQTIASLLGLAPVAEVAAAVQATLVGENAGLTSRAVLGGVAVVLAVRLSRRQRLPEAVVLASFGVVVVLDAVGLLPGMLFLHDRSALALGAVAALFALAGALFALARGRFDRSTAVGVMTVVLLAVLYPHRAVLSEPLTAVLASAGPVVLVLGLAWRVLTEAQVTYASTPRYPQSTRVLLFLANTLFATTSVAFLTLSRARGSDADPVLWGELGDYVLGEPLYVAGLVAGVWLALRAPARPDSQASR